MTLRRSILLSCALHLLLVGTGLTFSRFAGDLLQKSHQPIVVALIGREGTLPSGGPKAAAPRTVPRQTREQKRETAQSRPPQTPVEKRSTVPEPAPILQKPAQQSENAGQQNMLQGSRQTAPAGPESAGAARQQAAAGSQSGDVSSEQWAVIVSSIERVKSYPRLARERGIEGVVRLRFRLKPRGDVERVEIVKSSGSDILDTASVKTLYQAGPLPYVSGWVEVPIAYVLK